MAKVSLATCSVRYAHVIADPDPHKHLSCARRTLRYWNCYPCNALGQPDLLIEPHEDYLRLGREPAERQAVYRDLFRVHIDPELLKAVRQATQTNRVFGAAYFQKQIEAALTLRIAKRKPGPQRRETWDNKELLL